MPHGPIAYKILMSLQSYNIVIHQKHVIIIAAVSLLTVLQNYQQLRM